MSLADDPPVDVPALTIDLDPTKPVVEARLAGVRLEPDHALLVARGCLTGRAVTELHQVTAALLTAGVRYLVVDLGEVTACGPRLVAALADAARTVLDRRGWLRAVAVAPSVTAAFSKAAPPDLMALYRACRGDSGDSSVR